MDPLGARSQFIDVQTLPTWQQQLGEDVKETPLNQSESLLGQEAFPSPFPIRPDINRKIILLWVTQNMSSHLLLDFEFASSFGKQWIKADCRKGHKSFKNSEWQTVHLLCYSTFVMCQFVPSHHQSVVEISLCKGKHHILVTTKNIIWFSNTLRNHILLSFIFSLLHIGVSMSL